MTSADDSPIERARRIVSRIGLFLISGLFIAGLTLWAIGQSSASTRVLGSACAMLIGMPVLGVVAVLAEEIRRRDWPFVCAAAFVLLLLLYSVTIAVD